MKTAMLLGLMMAMSCWAVARETASAPTTQPAGASETKNLPPSSVWVEPSHEAQSPTLYKTYYSKTIQGEHSYLLYLPPAYERNTEKRYPVLYFLAGGQMDQKTSRGIMVFLDDAIRSGKIPPLIIVAPQGPAGTMWTDTYDGKTPIETVIIHDLIPYVDATYRTIPTRAGRWIEGFSVGGRGSAHLGFEYPDLFGAVGIFSGALMDMGFFEKWSGGQMYKYVCGSSPEYFNKHDPAHLVEKNADAIRGRTVIRLMVGTADTMGSQQVPEYNVHQADSNFHNLLNQLNIQHEFIEVPGVGHAYGPLLTQTGDRALKFYQDAFARLAASESASQPDADERR